MRDLRPSPTSTWSTGTSSSRRPDGLWLTDITEHPTDEGKVYCAAVIDVFSRRIVGWSIADNMRTELVVDALGMAITPTAARTGESTILHSDHGCQFTSWAFGRRLVDAGLVAVDGLDRGLLRQLADGVVLGHDAAGTARLRNWETRAELATAIFEWIECWYNPLRRHSSIGMLSPADYEAVHTPSDTDH